MYVPVHAEKERKDERIKVNVHARTSECRCDIDGRGGICGRARVVEENLAAMSYVEERNSKGRRVGGGLIID